jgi:hypothetical protein
VIEVEVGNFVIVTVVVVVVVVVEVVIEVVAVVVLVGSLRYVCSSCMYSWRYVR